jgi:glycosyltransferase involved in cell wall biosynthesis
MNVIIGIPAINEEATIVQVIEEIQLVMNKTKHKYKVYVQDDGSTDNTATLARKAGAKVFSFGRNKGLAAAFRAEMEHFKASKADVFVHTDADGQYPAEFIPQMLEKMEEGYDLVLGSRFSGEIEAMPIIKRIGNMAFAKVFTQLCNATITDSTTGFRAFTREVAESIEYTTTFTYTQEQLIRAAREKFRITEVPIFARKTRESRLMKGPLDYAIKAWINIFRIYRDYDPLIFFGKIGIGFITIGLLLGLHILYNVLQYGIAGGIPRVILAALLILTGMQVMLFGLLADMKG